MTGVGTTLVAVTEDATRQRIADNELAYLLRTLNDVVPATAHDNRMYADTIEVTDPDLLGSDRPVTVYRATRDGQPVAVILTPVAPVGYSGPIRLLVGIDAQGIVTGVRVLDHQETPGLGDRILTDPGFLWNSFMGFPLFQGKPDSEYLSREFPALWF